MTMNKDDKKAIIDKNVCIGNGVVLENAKKLRTYDDPGERFYIRELSAGGSEILGTGTTHHGLQEASIFALRDGVLTIVVIGKSDPPVYAACVVLASTRLDVNKVVVYGFLPNTQRNGQPARIHGRFFKQCDYLLSQCFWGHDDSDRLGIF